MLWQCKVSTRPIWLLLKLISDIQTCYRSSTSKWRNLAICASAGLWIRRRTGTFFIIRKGSSCRTFLKETLQCPGRLSVELFHRLGSIAIFLWHFFLIKSVWCQVSFANCWATKIQSRQIPIAPSCQVAVVNNGCETVSGVILLPLACHFFSIGNLGAHETIFILTVLSNT